MIFQEARKAVPLKWTFRFRFAKPTQKRVQGIGLNSTFLKNVSGRWSAWNVQVLFSSLFCVLSWPKSSKTVTQVCKVQSHKSEKSCKNRHFLVTESCKIVVHFAHFGFSPKCTNFFILHGFSEISQKVFPTFFTFLILKVYGGILVVKYTFFLALSGCCSLETVKRNVGKLLSKHLWSILIVSDHFFEKRCPKMFPTDFCQGPRTF